MNLKVTNITKHVKGILSNLSVNPKREGLLGTPERYAKFIEDFTNFEKREFVMTCFDSEDADEMVTVKDIVFYSLCEHHMLPFFGTATVAYIPNKKIVGLSKIPRLVEYYSHMLQNQERITNQIADHLQKHSELEPLGVAVHLNARHMCMEMRGVCKPNASTDTTAFRGVFRQNPSAKSEFLSKIK